MPKYDVAVVGAGIGGLLTAAFLAKNNKRVVLLEPSADLAGALGFVDKQGFRFSPIPALSYGFEQGGVIASACAELGIPVNASLRSPGYQVALPDRRISVFAETAATHEELRREFPREIDAVVRLYRDMTKTAVRVGKSRIAAFRARWVRAASALARYRFSNELLTYFDIQSRTFFHLPAADISLMSLITLLTTPPLSLQGGIKKFSGQLLDVVLRNGGEVRYAVPWPEISFIARRVEGLTTKNGFIEADFLVFNSRQGRPSPSLFLGIKEDVLPVGMGLDVICLPDYGRPAEYYTLSVSSGDDGETAPKGMRAVSACFPHLAPSHDLTKELLKQVAGVIPFLDQYLIFAQEFTPSGRSYPFPPDVVLRPLKTTGDRSILERARASANIYCIEDGTGWLGQAVHAARKITEKLT